MVGCSRKVKYLVAMELSADEMLEIGKVGMDGDV